MRLSSIALLIGLLVVAAVATGNESQGGQIIQRVLSSDPWGLSGADISARITLIDKGGSRREMAFEAQSLQYDPPLAKSIVRFSAPPELAGAGFLQVQRKDADDERFLYLPELGRSRRIAGSSRSGSFMGTDFTFADLDRRDLRDAQATLVGEEKLGDFACFVVNVIPRRSDSPYSRIDLFVRTDNHLPLRMKLFDRGGALFKTFEAQQVRRVDGQWFISKSRMFNEQQKHTTELSLERIVTTKKFDDETFTVRALEKH